MIKYTHSHLSFNLTTTRHTLKRGGRAYLEPRTAKSEGDRTPGPQRIAATVVIVN